MGVRLIGLTGLKHLGESHLRSGKQLVGGGGGGGRTGLWETT